MAIKTVQSEILSELYSQTLLIDPTGIENPPVGEVLQGIYDDLRWTKNNAGVITWQSIPGGRWLPYYVYDKAEDISVTAVYPLWQRINTLDYTIPAGYVILEFKMSLTFNLGTNLQSAYFRFSIDAGTSWTVIITEPSDKTNDIPLTYFFPKEFAEPDVILSQFLLEAAGEDESEFTIHFSDLMVEKVLE